MININNHNITPSVPGRLIPCLTAPGQLHMQIDAWLLQEYIAGRMPPTLRFYQWSPAAISLGYHQHRYPAEWKDLTWQGEAIDIVRRPTGGRAVLHQGDLTYSLVTNGQGSRLALYQQICQFLLVGWQQLGIELSYGNQGREYRDQPNCFATSTGADLVLANGYKFIGSAQVIREGAVLQHGSMRLKPEKQLLEEVFGHPIQPSPSELANWDHREIIATLVQAASNCWGIDFQLQSLTKEEMVAIKQLQDK